MVDYALDYPYSSAAYYVLGKDDGLTQQDPLFETFGSDLKQRQAKYREFLKTFNEEEERLFENLEDPQGTKEFVSRLVKERGLYLPKVGRPAK